MLDHAAIVDYYLQLNIENLNERSFEFDLECATLQNKKASGYRRVRVSNFQYTNMRKFVPEDKKTILLHPIHKLERLRSLNLRARCET